MKGRFLKADRRPREALLPWLREHGEELRKLVPTNGSWSLVHVPPQRTRGYQRTSFWIARSQGVCFASVLQGNIAGFRSAWSWQSQEKNQ
jgi:hypothetical protein